MRHGKTGNQSADCKIAGIVALGKAGGCGAVSKQNGGDGLQTAVKTGRLLVSRTLIQVQIIMFSIQYKRSQKSRYNQKIFLLKLGL